MKNRFFTERGQAMIIIALVAIGLVGIVGLAIDGGAKFSDQRNAQNAADTAAMAAALAKVTALENGDSNTPPQCPPPSGTPSDVCSDLLSAGYARATSNGYDGNLITNTVAVYSPPVSGPYAGNDSYVQVIITSLLDTTFSRVIGINQTQNVVQATAFVYEGGDLADGAMIISYDPDPNCSTTGTGGNSVSVSGSSTVNLNGGGIFLNSDEVCGFVIPNCADLNIYGGTINSAGNNIDLGSCTFDPPVTPNINQDPVSIPDEVFWPDVPPECGVLATAYNDPPGSNTWHITPGYYSDFPQSSINGDIVANKKDIIMDPGVYCVGKDIKWSGNTFTSLDGSSGVTIYIKSGFDFSLSINSPIELYAPNSGDYQGYLIIQEGTHTDIQSCIINGGVYLDINGLIFAPYCDITINGGSDPTAEINAQLVGWDIKINGTTTINFNYDPSNQVVIKSKLGLMR